MPEQEKNTPQLPETQEEITKKKLEAAEKKLEGYKKRLANLRPAKKGEIRNPRGRPRKEECLTDIVREMLYERPNLRKKDGTIEKRIWMELVAEATIRLAIKGNSTALKEVWDRIDGKQAQTLDLNIGRIENVLKQLPPPGTSKNAGLEGRPDLLHRELLEGTVEGGPRGLPSANGAEEGSGGVH